MLLEQKAYVALKYIHSWSSTNKLTINHSKSSLLIIPPKQIISTPESDIKYNESKIAIKKYFKCLGVEIDSHLNFQRHIKSIKQKLSQSVGIMLKFRHVLSTKTLNMIYHTKLFQHNQANIFVRFRTTRLSASNLNFYLPCFKTTK